MEARLGVFGFFVLRVFGPNIVCCSEIAARVGRIDCHNSRQRVGSVVLGVVVVPPEEVFRVSPTSITGVLRQNSKPV